MDTTTNKQIAALYLTEVIRWTSQVNTWIDHPSYHDKAELLAFPHRAEGILAVLVAALDEQGRSGMGMGGNAKPVRDLIGGTTRWEVHDLAKDIRAVKGAEQRHNPAFKGNVLALNKSAYALKMALLDGQVQ